MDKAEKVLKTAKNNIRDEDYDSAVNRAYYCVFHMISELLILSGKSYRSHSAVIAEFQREYVKTGVFGADIKNIIFSLSENKNDSDYTDFFYIDETEAKIQVDNAEKAYTEIRRYIESLI